MKKVLLATSALVASAGFAAADVDVSGSAQMGVEYNEDNSGQTTTFNSEVAIAFDASVETDHGLTVSANTNYKVNQGLGSDGTVSNDDTTVSIAGAMWSLSMGAVTEADRLIGLGDLGLDGLGTDDIAEAFSGSNLASANTNFTFNTGALTFAVSGNLGALDGDGVDNGNDQAFAVGAQYDAGSFAVALGYGEDGAGTDATSVGVSADAGPVVLAALYTDNSSSGEAYGVTAAYTSGAATFTLAYSDNDDSTDASYGVGIAYALGGGATLKGGIATINGTNKADLGVAISF